MNGREMQAHRTIPASGPLVLRRADGAVPAGYLGWGPHWAAAFPPDLKAAELTETPLGIAIGKPKDKDETRDQITRFWNEAISALLPVPEPRVPWSEAGLTAGKELASPIAGAMARAGQIDRHLSAMTKRRQAASDVPAFVDLLLRQIAVLRLPSDALAGVQRRGEDGWLLEFRETGMVGHLLGGLDWFPPAKKDKSGRLETAPRTGTVVNDAAILIALARAVQLAQLAVASGLGRHDRLRVEVCNPGLGGRKLALVLAPEDRGLALARLARQLSRDLRLKELRAGMEGLPCRPGLVEDHGGLMLSEDAGPDSEPLRWHGQDEALPLRWVYSGDQAVSTRYPQGLPFALVPGNVRIGAARGPGFSTLPAPDRREYLDWLSGVRRAEGFRPVFAHLYLQGLEYRILADGASQEEAALLTDEIRAVRALLDGSDPLLAAVGRLLDWLAATGKCARGPLVAEGPLTCLVVLGRAVAQGESLSSADLAALRKVVEAAGGRNMPAAGEGAGPEGLILPPPAKPLAAGHVSLSGLCDQKRQLFMHDGRPLPDLRNSMRLRAVFALLPTVGEGRR